jgi:predicted small lipoprotein YifL
LDNRKAGGIDNCLKSCFSILLLISCFLLLTSLTACGRRGDPVLVPIYEENILTDDAGKNKEGEKQPSGSLTKDEAPGREETAAVVPGAPSGLSAVYTGRSIVLVWNEVLKQGVISYRIYRSAGEVYVLAGETVSPAFTDRDIEKHKKYFYKITAVARSESLPSEEITVETEGE